MAKKVLFHGPDISSHQGVVDVKQIKNAGCGWIALRAGYGKNNVDQRYPSNAQACYNLNMKTMIYWFSYALNLEMVANEALYAIAQAKKYWGKCPIAFDLEYDTIRYASTRGVAIGKTLATDMAITFLSVVKENGYIPVIYTNRDYIRNYFDMDKITAALGTVYVWYARYGLSKLPASEENIPDIWQYTSKGSLPGVKGNVDLNYFYTDFISAPTKVEDNKPSKTTNLYILEFQKAANADGYRDAAGKKLVEDGIDGPKTQYVRQKITLKAKKVGLIWKVGSKGEVVKWFQKRCNEVLGHSQKVDGLYGKTARKDCIAVQDKLALKEDGVAGKNTLQALFYN